MRTDPREPGEADGLAQRRSRAVTTAWILAAVAIAIFLTFILSGVLGR